MNADRILPDALLKEIQNYVQGEQIYIPRRDEDRLGWGMKNGTRRMIAARNREIRRLRTEGYRVYELADRFGLSPDSIRKILQAG
jgi:Mor family transcriptional regulator